VPFRKAPGFACAQGTQSHAPNAADDSESTLARHKGGSNFSVAECHYARATRRTPRPKARYSNRVRARLGALWAGRLLCMHTSSTITVPTRASSPLTPHQRVDLTLYANSARGR
jgi:hypothetical protein